MKCKIVSDATECEKLWKQFSPNKSVFDQWDYKMAWKDGFGYDFHFVVLYEGSKPVGLLPLWYNTDDKIYEWVCGYWVEDNRVYVKNPKYVSQLMKYAPSPIRLSAIESFDGIADMYKIEEFGNDTDNKFIKDLTRFKTITDYLLTLKKKNRYNLRRDYESILDHHPEVIHEDAKDHMKDFEILVDMNVKRLDEVGKTRSEFAINKKDLQSFHNTITYAKNYSCKFIKVTIGKVVAAIDMIVTYKKNYYLFRGGNDVSRFPGIGNFMVYTEINDAITNGYELIDCLQEDSGWKHRYFDEKQLYEIKPKK